MVRSVGIKINGSRISLTNLTSTSTWSPLLPHSFSSVFVIKDQHAMFKV